MTNVHLVPHTHNDVGWLITVDQYYYQRVQYILETTISQLVKDPTRRFIYVEIAFFKRWWDQQDFQMKQTVTNLVNNGQMEFILGGWSMNDEGATHYNAKIDQHTLGFRFLEETFGDCARPRVAWQIDPFGHSREQASLFAQMAFDGLFFGRLDYQDKRQRIQSETMEMVWEANPSLADLFTGVLDNVYSPPLNFCFETTCTSNFIMVDERLHDDNVRHKVLEFLQHVVDQGRHFTTNHILVTMGDDFAYHDADTWYKNMDKLIKYVNEQQSIMNTSVNLLYSTPSCYLYQLHRVNKTWSTKKDDFMPYAVRPHSFLTGFYSSRPALKGYIRQTNNFLQVCQQMNAFSLLSDNDKIEALKESMGVAQHHDAVSGTEKQVVAYDYAERLANGINNCQQTISRAYQTLLAKSDDEQALDQQFCHLLNISMCMAIEGSDQQFVIILYNPLTRAVGHWVRVPVSGNNYTVTSLDGVLVRVQIIPVSKRTMEIPERKSRAVNELVFLANIPYMGFATYFVETSQAKNRVIDMAIDNGDVVIQNEHISLSFQNGTLVEMQNLDSKIKLPLTQELLFYRSFGGNNTATKFQSSGAYIFRPNGTKPERMAQPEIVIKTKIMRGQLVQEVEQIFSPWLTQVVRLYEDARYAEFEWTVGPIPITDKSGKEIISQFKSNIFNNATFYTDANGRQILQRRLNHRDTWKFSQTEHVAGNYFPVNSRIFIRDEARRIQLTVLTDRSQGGTSLHDGEIELMVHRRLLHDDALGVNEALNETGSDGKGLIVRGKHYLFVDTIDNSAELHRDMALKLYMSPVISFVPRPFNYTSWVKHFKTSWTGLHHDLPANVHLLTLENLRENTYMVRLEHFYEKNEDTSLSMAVEVSLSGLFIPFEVTSAVELTLGANQKLSDSKRLHWRTANAKGRVDTMGEESVDEKDPLTFMISPMQIRTFEVTVKPTVLTS